MTIRRSPSPIRDNFTILPNATLNDSRLTWQARGLLAYLLSKPDHWRVIVKSLVKESPAGRDAVYTILKELETHGYITYEQTHENDGTFAETERVVHEVSCISPDGTAYGSTVYGSAVYGSAVYGQPVRLVRTDLEKELTEVRTDESSLPISGETGDKPKKATSEIQPYLKEFEEIWALYPRKVGRKPAYDKFVATMRKGISLDELRVAVQNYATVRNGQEMNFTLHAATFWGPAERWRDYLPEGEALKTAIADSKPKGFSAIADFLRRGE